MFHFLKYLNDVSWLKVSTLWQQARNYWWLVQDEEIKFAFYTTATKVTDVNTVFLFVLHHNFIIRNKWIQCSCEWLLGGKIGYSCDTKFSCTPAPEICKGPVKELKNCDTREHKIWDWLFGDTVWKEKRWHPIVHVIYTWRKFPNLPANIKAFSVLWCKPIQNNEQIHNKVSMQTLSINDITNVYISSAREADLDLTRDKAASGNTAAATAGEQVDPDPSWPLAGGVPW